jgi:hydroxymethylpyrimidine pyrophosphatase-like HAD family hydrolase
MLLRTIALDYDGTIATNGALHPKVREAIREARNAGLLVIIVTGRILQELRRVAGDLSFVDAVVAENGAVILLSNSHRRMLAPPPFPVLLNELSNRGIEFAVGRCLVDLDAEHANTVLSILKELELPLAISFNRNRIMVLPQSISKSSGIREILNILGTSIHNALGIGDAENDYELLQCCEYGVAVDWAPRLLKDRADFVIPGEGPESVAEYISQVSSETRLPLGVRRHRKLVLESIAGQAPLEMAIRGRNILVAGDSKSGKSWLAGLLCEQMILQHYTVLIFDPEGDYGSLHSLPNTIVLGGNKLLPILDDLMEILHQGLSIVLDLSHLDHDDKVSFIREHLALTAKYRRNKGYPHYILLDECHYFLDCLDCEGLLDTELGAYILVTYRPSQLPTEVLQSFEAVIATRIVEKNEVEVVEQLAPPLSVKGDLYKLLGNLETTEAALLPPTEEVKGEPYRFTVAPRLTAHVRHRTKYFEIPIDLEQAFIFTDNGTPTGECARTLRELAVSANSVNFAVITGHLQRHDFSNWISSAFKDHDLANVVRKLESQHCKDVTVSTFSEKLSAEIEERYKHSSK